MAQITINDGLAWLKALKKRHEELVALRNDNAHRERRFYGAAADKELVKEPDVEGGLWGRAEGRAVPFSWAVSVREGPE